MRTRTGYTLMEVMVTTAVLSIIAAFAAPMLTDTSRMRVMAASSVLASDIELAQVMTLSNPDQAMAVRFDPPQETYWLALAATPDVPILREDTGDPYVVTFGLGRAAGAEGVTLEVEGVTDSTIEFAPMGGIVDFAQTPVVRMELGPIWFELTVAPTTGTVTETSGEE